MEQAYFKFYKTFDEILSYPWDEFGQGKVNGVPESLNTENLNLEIRKIKYWEQIYQDPGNIGIYAAHSPLLEIYLVIFYPILDDNLTGVIEFRGEFAKDEIVNYSKLLGINLSPSN